MHPADLAELGSRLERNVRALERRNALKCWLSDGAPVEPRQYARTPIGHVLDVTPGGDVLIKLDLLGERFRP